MEARASGTTGLCAGGAALGIDVTDAVAWAGRLARCPALGRTAFTALELRESGGDPERLAMVWAVKEAVVKALGTGFAGIGWRGVEVRCPYGRPAAVRLTGAPPIGDLRVVRLAVRAGPRAGAGSLPVLAAVALGGDVPPPVAARTCPIAGAADGPRAGRAAQASAAARRTAEAAARTLLRDTGWVWDRTPQGAPLLRTAGGRWLSVALSHGAGIAAAIVAAPVVSGSPPPAPVPPAPVQSVPRDLLTRDPLPRGPEPPREPGSGKRSPMLTIIDSDYLLEGVSVRA